MQRTTLHGGCACGRNHYTIQVPATSTPTHLATIVLDNSRRNRLHQATPFTAFLRVPLAWYHSSASPFFPDEPLSLIRRTFHEPEPEPEQHPLTPPQSTASAPPAAAAAAASTTTTMQTSTQRAAGLRRQFCGYCGTPLSAWHERTPHDADFISLTLGSLAEDDVHGLAELGLFSPAEDGGDEDDEVEVEIATTTTTNNNNNGDNGSKTPSASRPVAASPRFDRTLFAPLQVTSSRGAPWFESLVQDSRLGRLRRSRGGYRSKDGSVREEWEVVEWGSGGDGGEGEDGGSLESSSSSSLTTGKRKIGEVVGGAGEDTMEF